MSHSRKFSIRSQSIHFAIASVGLALLVGCGAGRGILNSAPPPPATVPASQHVVMVMEENQEYSTVVDNTKDWPHLNNLITSGALATNYYANVHFSIGNYFMLTTGQVLTVDDNSVQVFNADNIARRMIAAKVPFKVYAEGITQGYVGGNTGLYLVRHNPFALLSDVASDPAEAKAVLCPFSQFATDVANNTLPAFSFIVPNIDDNAHSAAALQADTWLQEKVVTPLVGNAAFKAGGDGVLIVDFDESVATDLTHGGGHVPVVFWGPKVAAGYQQKTTAVYQHENMLATIMAALSLPNPPGAAATASTMGEFFTQ